MMQLVASLVVGAAALAQQAADPGVLTLPAPITRWDDAIPLGNGLLGGLLWGEGNTVRLSLDRGDLWDDRTPEMLQRPDWTYAKMIALKEAHDHKTHQGMFDVPYDTVPYPTKLPGGRLEIALDPGSTSTAFALELKTGEARVELSSGSLTAFYSAKKPVAMMRVTGPAPTLKVVRPAGLDKLGYEAAEFGEDETAKWMVQRAVTGLEYAVAIASQREGNATTLAVTIESLPPERRSGPNALGMARATVSEALRDGYDKTLADSAAWWSRYWGTSSISIPDPGLQRHYDLCRYYYGAASSPDAPPIPLQGVWTCDNGDLPPW